MLYLCYGFSTFPPTSVQPNCLFIKLATNIYLFFFQIKILYLFLAKTFHRILALAFRSFNPKMSCLFYMLS